MEISELNKSKKATNEVIEPHIFLDYFQELHREKKSQNNKHFDKKIHEFVANMSNKKYIEVGLMDHDISKEELSKVVNSLKNGKATVFDIISNEMIKSSVSTLSNLYLKLFNHVLISEILPEKWCEGYIIPIYKKGYTNLSSNYRGITIVSTLGKLFTKLLNQRLHGYLADIYNYIIKSNQIGFTPHKRTSDAENYSGYI